MAKPATVFGKLRNGLKPRAKRRQSRASKLEAYVEVRRGKQRTRHEGTIARIARRHIWPTLDWIWKP